MAKEFKPWSAAKCARVAAKDAALRVATDRQILAGIAAIKDGADIHAAVDAARDAPRASARDAAAGRMDGEDLAPLLDLRKLRVDGWTVAMQRDFVRTLADTGCVSHAATAVGVSRNTAYAMRNRAGHSTFALAWDVAVQLGRKRLLDVAMERAILGQEHPVWFRGEQVGTRTVHNDRLLTFLIGHTPAPAHGALSPDELAAMFPAMLDAIDTLLPHPLAVRLAAEDAAAKAEDENEDEE